MKIDKIPLTGIKLLIRKAEFNSLQRIPAGIKSYTESQWKKLTNINLQKEKR